MNKREEEISRGMLENLIEDATDRGLSKENARLVVESVLRDPAPGQNPWLAMVKALDARLQETGVLDERFDPESISKAATELVGAVTTASTVLYEVEKELGDRPLLQRIVKDVAFDLDNAQFANPLTELADVGAVA